MTDELDPPFVEPADPPTVGESLRAAREGAGLSIEDVAQQLKLAPRQVQALEDDDFAKLPGRTFVRGFVRNYARAFGLDAEDLVARLPGGEPSLERPTITPSGPPIGSMPAPARRNWARRAIPLLLVAIVGAAGVYEMRRPQSDARRTAPDKGSSNAVAPSPAAGGPTTLPNPLASDASVSGAVATPPAGADPASSASSAPAGAADTAPGAAAPAGGTSAAVLPATPPLPASVSPGTAANAGEPLLVLSFQRSSWVQVRDRNGNVLLAQNAPAGSTQAIAGPLPLDLVVGNASDVTATFRGQPVDLAPFVRGNVARLSLK